MVPGTHFIISNILYNYIENNLNFKLDLSAFVWGNLRPDFDKKHIRCSHTLEDSLDFINFYANKIIQNNMSITEFSMLLGVICHFICDYFCIYHSKEYWRKDMLEHFTYEILLHVKLLILLNRGNLNIKYNYKQEDSMEVLLKNILKKYNLKEKSLVKDLVYAIKASASVCEFIITSSYIYRKNIKNSINETNAIPN